MIRGIIIGHGNFARSLLNTVELILGKQEFVDTFSNYKMSKELLINNLKSLIEEDPHDKILFIDLPGGSCGIACLNLVKTYRNIKILAGVNLPMLLEFFLLRDKYPLEELASILLKKGRDNIIILESKSKNTH